MLLVTLIHEFNHYVRRVDCTGEDVTKCLTDRRENELIIEGGEDLLKAIFGVKYFNEWSYKQALEIYNHENWKISGFFKKLYIEHTNPSILSCMTINEKRRHCVEGYRDYDY